MALLAVTAVAALLLVAGGEREGSTAAAKGPFGPHYAGLETRRKAARIPTMMDTMSSRAHFHTQLRVYIDGEPLEVPANIGIDPGRDSMEMAGLHTHDTSGQLHAEGVERATLGQFFAIWGVAFAPNQLGPHRSTATKTVRMWVDGKPHALSGRLELRDGQRIFVSYGPKDAPAPGGIQG